MMDKGTGEQENRRLGWKSLPKPLSLGEGRAQREIVAGSPAHLLGLRAAVGLR
jgi:hypothetical protein